MHGHLRGGAGNVAMRAGLRPTAKAVATPPDATAGAPALYPTSSDSVDEGRSARDSQERQETVEQPVGGGAVSRFGAYPPTAY